VFTVITKYQPHSRLLFCIWLILYVMKKVAVSAILVFGSKTIIVKAIIKTLELGKIRQCSV